MAAAAFTPAAVLQHSSYTSSSHWVAYSCPLITTAGLVTLRCSRSLQQFSTFCSRNQNADVRSSSSALQRSQFLGNVLGVSRIYLPLPHRSKAIHSAVHSILGNQFQTLYRARSSHCLLCAVVGQDLRSRSTSSLFQDRVYRRRCQTKVRNPGCVGTSAAAGVMTLKPFVDQVLLLATVLGVYIAGVASLPRLPVFFPERAVSLASSPSLKRKPFQQQNPTLQASEYAGEDGWVQLQSKISRAMLRETTATEEEQLVKGPVLGLQAVARVPRLHLLLTTLQHLRKEVEAISDAEQYADLQQWQDLTMNVISSSVAPICRAWVLQELWLPQQPTDVAERVLASVGVAKPLICKEESAFKDMAGSTRNETQRGDVETSNSMEMSVLDNMMDIMKQSESIPSYLTRSGKAGLYADLIFFLRFGSARLRGCCDHRVFKKHTGNVLEDMVVAVAEVVATLFLDCSSQALSPHGETWQTFLVPSILSSRSLERFRNEVALYGWLNENFTSVAAMFEDRFDLWTVQRWTIPSRGKKQNKSLTKKLVMTEMGVKSEDLVLTRSQLPARRSTELKALRGWRYYYSLFLELSDVVGPLLRILVSKVGEGVSFLLMILIGRSLGLVYQGIRQSVRWPSSQKEDRAQ